jgi:hypothetical protein
MASTITTSSSTTLKSSSTSTSSYSSSSSTPGSFSNNTTKIGAGVGVPLDIIILIVSGFAFFLWRRTHSNSATGRPDGHADPDFAVYMKPELPATMAMPLPSSSVIKDSDNTWTRVGMVPAELALG